LSTRLPNGQTLGVFETSTPDRTGFVFERRYPDGTRDRQFGPRGRVYFEMGSPGGEPTALVTDKLGHILVVGASSFDQRPRGAVVFRFLSTGLIDSGWGNQGQAQLPLARGDSLAADVLPQADGSLLVVGTVDDAGSQRASIWRVAASGQADAHFGRQGVMLAESLPMSRALSIQQGPDGARQLAIQTSEGGKSWIEVHRWRDGDPLPLRVARQELPPQWVGPAALVFRSGQWFWIDPSRPDDPLAVTALKVPDSPWTAADTPAAAIATADVQDAPGHAAMNPYAVTAVDATIEPSEPGPTSSWLVVAALGVLFAGAVIWRTKRH
jgi:hypothetical protein